MGPGVIVLGASIGSGEFLLGPAAFVQYGLVLLWVTLVAAFFQTVFNTELMRWTIATGEPVVTGFMRTKPWSQFWAWVYALLYFLQVGWPGWAGAAAGAIFFLIFRDLAGPGQEHIVYWIGVGTFGLCVGNPALREADRTHARAAELGAGVRDHRRVPDPGGHLRGAGHLGLCCGGARRLRHRHRRFSASFRKGWTGS